MGEDRYRLAAIRDARARDERVRRHDLAAAVGGSNDAASRVVALHTRADAARVELDRASAARPRAGVARDIALADQFVARRRRDLATALAELDRARAMHAEHRGMVGAAQDQLARARADREVIERHFATWRDARKRLAERRED